MLNIAEMEKTSRDLDEFKLLEAGWDGRKGKRITQNTITLAKDFLIKITPHINTRKTYVKLESCSCPNGDIFVRFRNHTKELEIYLTSLTEIEFMKIDKNECLDHGVGFLKDDNYIQSLGEWISFSPIFHHPV